MLSENRKYFIYGLVLALFTISSYLAYITSPELSVYFGYADLYVMFKKQLIAIFLGVIIIFLLNNLDASIWFNRIGASIFTISIILLILMLLVPDSITQYISAQKLYIVFNGVVLAPILFFGVGSLWLISWINSAYKNVKFTNSIILFLMIVTAGFCLAFNDMSSLVLLEILFMSLLVYINGMVMWVLATLLSFFSLGVLFVFMAEHRMIRIKSWWELSSNYMTALAVDSTLHENFFLSLMDKLGISTLLVVIIFFLLLSYALLSHKHKDASYKIFTVGIVSLILISLMLNILYTFGLSPIYPPALYLLGYGANVVITSSVMIGMLLMIQRKYNDGRR